MPGKYRINAAYILSTEVEPEGRLGGVEDAEGVIDYSDDSSFDRASVSCNGGELTFEVEADHEEHAGELARMALDSAYYSGDGYFEWEIEDYTITDIECIEPPMDQERAIELVRSALDRMVETSTISTEEQSAFLFLLDLVTP